MSRRPTALPRGIEAFLPSDETEFPAIVSVECLTPNPFQPRRTVAGIEELAASIAEHGMLQPILARPNPARAGHFQIVAGERRWRAAQSIRLHDVPVLVRDMDDKAVAGAALVENLQRENLNPIDEADGYARMVREFGLTQDGIASVIGKSRSHVANTLRLLNLGVAATQALRDGRITAGHARALLAHPNPDAGLRAILSRDLSVRQAERLARTNADIAEPKGTDPDLDALCVRLTEALGIAATIATQGERGTLTLKFSSLDQLDGLITLLMPA